MLFITRQDDISVLPLSVRSQNCLRRADIHTVGSMIDYPVDELINIRNMGKKSVEEIQHWINVLLKGSKDYVLEDHVGTTPEDNDQCVEEVVHEIAFLDGNGAVIEDILIENTMLSVRAKNSLKNTGIQFISQLINKTPEELMNIKNMGRKTVDEILKFVSEVKITYGETTKDQENTDVPTNAQELVSELVGAYGQTESTWLRELLIIERQYPDAIGEILVYRLYEGQFVRATAKSAILKLIEARNGEISKNNLVDCLPKHLNNTTLLEELLLELEATRAIEIGEAMIRRQYPSVMQFVRQLKDEREKEVILARLEGKTLQEIGDQFGITRERARQITKKALRNKPYFREDKLAYLYNNYDFSEEDLFLAFDEPKETYHYLELISKNSREKRLSIEELLTDVSIAPELRRKAERAIYKKYVTIDGVRVRKNRPALVQFFVKTLCKTLTKYEEFLDKYQEQLDMLGLGGDPSLILESRTYERILNKCDYVLWNQWRSFRYYNIPDYDFSDLYAKISFEEFENMEISSLKLFRDYPELMEQYDIRDEYELHNLLKKIWPQEEQQITFKKMPTIEVGTSNRDDQLLSILIQYAPISAEEYASRYEDAYGTKAATVMANYMRDLDVYYYNGIYSITSESLSPEHFKRMKDVLKNTFYTIADVKRLYLREFPGADTSKINPYTLKMLDYRVYSGYIIKNTYQSAVDYFRELLLTDDIVDARQIGGSIQRIVAYSAELYRLRAAYEIVEFAPLQYINIRRLNTIGVTKDVLEKYCTSVAKEYEKGEYFTLTSLRKDGFSHQLDDLGFEEWFYSSILLENRDLFSYQRIGGTRVFLRGKNGANLSDMLVWLLERRHKMDFYDLQDVLQNYYGIILPKEKLLAIIEGTELYYDAIMEAVYIDYDTYFEEI